MTDHDALAALPLTPEEERQLREDVARSDAGTFRWVVPNDIRRLLTTLDAERGVRVAGDAGLREAARLALAAFDAENVAALGTDQDAAEEAALDTVDAMEVLRAALTASDVEAHPVGKTLLRMGNRIADLVKERDALLAQAAAADTAAPGLRSSAGWLVERWDGNRTVQPDALRADIAVLRDALRNPQALSTLESSPPSRRPVMPDTPLTPEEEANVWPEYVDHLVTGTSPSLLLDYILRDLRSASSSRVTPRRPSREAPAHPVGHPPHPRVDPRRVHRRSRRPGYKEPDR